MGFKTVRGMQDFLLERAAKKKWIEETCKKVFESYGFAPMETPTVEDFELLAKKGGAGEAIKNEVYYFKDKSKRELGLRFDLTVPLGRVMASNPQLARPFKRYAIGRVYRYDRPQAKRYREFTQADVDVLGSSSPLADFEILSVAIDVMTALGFKKEEFKIKINSRPLLGEIALCCGVENKKIVDCFRCIDKLNKIGEKGVEKELKEKGIKTQILGQLSVKNPKNLKLKNPAPLKKIMDLLRLLKKSKLDGFVELDLSLARGLEYYTGMVAEVTVANSPSVGGGGRYDKLVESYGGKETPAVGLSFGVERLLDSLEERLKPMASADLFFIPVGDKAVEEGIGIASKIRALGVNCETDLMNRGIGKNIQYADKKGILFVAILGEKELKEKALTLKNLKSGKQQIVKLADLAKLKQLVEK
jgi:histidyl-tRNA synthetase